MQAGKLFRILVVGGSLLLTDVACDAQTDPSSPTSSDSGGSPPPPGDQDDAGQTENVNPAADSGMSMANNDAGGTNPDPTGDDAGIVAFSDAGVDPLAECFCPTEECCEEGEDGGMTVREGFVCCWSTTC